MSERFTMVYAESFPVQWGTDALEIVRTELARFPVLRWYGAIEIVRMEGLSFPVLRG